MRVVGRDAADAALDVAERHLRIGQRESGQAALRVATMLIDALTSLNPVTGFARDVIECVWGRDLFSGAELTATDRALRFLSASATIATAGVAGTVMKGARILDEVSDAYRTTKILSEGSSLVESTRRTLQMARTEFRISKHALKRAQERSISAETVKDVVETGVAYWDREERTISYLKRFGGKADDVIRAPGKAEDVIHVAVDARELEVVTLIKSEGISLKAVIDDGSPRWIPIDMYE